MRVIWNCPLL